MNNLESFEQIFFTDKLFTGSVLQFCDYNGQESMRITVFGQGHKHPQVKVTEPTPKSFHEIARGFLIGSFVKIEDEVFLERGRIVQGSSLALETDGQPIDVPIPDSKITLVMPRSLPIL